MQKVSFGGMRTERAKVGSLRPHPKNPRVHPETNLRLIVDSLKRFGQLRPLVSWQGWIIAGCGTLEAIKRLGWAEADILRADRLTEAQALDFMVIDNRSTELSEFDPDLLAALVASGPERQGAMDAEGWDALGYRPMQAANLLHKVDPAKRSGLLGLIDGKTEQDAVGKVPKKATSQKGRVYCLGNHRMLCGDAADIDAVERRLFGEFRADLLFTDPPYGVSYSDKNEYLERLGGKDNLIQTAIEGDNRPDKLQDFLAGVFRVWGGLLADCSAFYVMTATKENLTVQMIEALARADMPNRHVLIWSKGSSIIGLADYHYRHEALLYGWKDRHRFYGEGEQRSTVWEYPKPARNDLHPTQKPVALIENAILNSSKRGAIVSDPFLGSGSTLIAAERTGRVCFGAEIDPCYCDVIRRRWAEFVHGPGCDWLKATPYLKGKL